MTDSVMTTTHNARERDWIAALTEVITRLQDQKPSVSPLPRGAVPIVVPAIQHGEWTSVRKAGAADLRKARQNVARLVRLRADLELARDSFANTPPSLNALLKPAQQPNWTTTKAEILEGFGHTLTASQATRLDAIADDFFADVPKPFLMLIDRLTDDHRHIFATSTRVIGESLLTTRFGELNEPSQPARFALGTARRHLLAVVEELRKEVAEDHRHVFEVALSAADKLIVLSRRVLRRARSLSGAALENPVLAAHWGEVFYECVQMTIAAYLVAWASVTRLEGGAPNALWARIRRRAREMSTSVDGRPATLVRGASLADYPDGSHVRVGGSWPACPPPRTQFTQAQRNTQYRWPWRTAKL